MVRKKCRNKAYIKALLIYITRHILLLCKSYVKKLKYRINFFNFDKFYQQQFFAVDKFAYLINILFA